MCLVGCESSLNATNISTCDLCDIQRNHNDNLIIFFYQKIKIKINNNFYDFKISL